MTAPSSKGVAEDDLRLVALSLISETPRRGYEVIQTIEKMTADWFLPSPNKVHPMLASLVESGHLTASTETFHDHRRGPRLSRTEPRSCRCRSWPPERAWRTRHPLATGAGNGGANKGGRCRRHGRPAGCPRPRGHAEKIRRFLRTIGIRPAIGFAAPK